MPTDTTPVECVVSTYRVTASQRDYSVRDMRTGDAIVEQTFHESCHPETRLQCGVQWLVNTGLVTTAEAAAPL